MVQKLKSLRTVVLENQLQTGSKNLHNRGINLMNYIIPVQAVYSIWNANNIVQVKGLYCLRKLCILYVQSSIKIRLPIRFGVIIG